MASRTLASISLRSASSFFSSSFTASRPWPILRSPYENHRASFFDHAVVDAQVDDLADLRDALAEHDVEFRTFERGCHLVLHDLHLGACSQLFFAVLRTDDGRDIDARWRNRGHCRPSWSRITVDDTDLSRSWLMKRRWTALVFEMLDVRLAQCPDTSGKPGGPSSSRPSRLRSRLWGQRAN